MYILGLISFLLIPASFDDSTPKIEDYLQATIATMHGESKEQDVDRLINLFHEDIVYEHPAVGISLEGKLANRKGKMSFLDSYGGNSSDSKFNILNEIVRGSTHIVEFEIEFLMKDGTKIQRTQVQVLEFADNKIKRIIDYW